MVRSKNSYVDTAPAFSPRIRAYDKGLVVASVVVNISFIENDQALKGF